MANELTGTAEQTNLYSTALDRQVEMYLRSMPTFRDLADKRPASVTNPGESVVFQIHGAFGINKAPLDEYADVDAVKAPNTTKVTVTINEYGNAAVSTKRARTFNLSAAGLESDLATAMAFNQVDTIDAIVSDVLCAGVNYFRENGGALVKGGARNSVAATDTFKARAVRQAVASLRGNSVPTKDGGLYRGYIHPHASLDLRTETGAAAWNQAVIQQAKDLIDKGSIGAFEGVGFFESPRVQVVANGSGVQSYVTHIAGAQALAEAVADEPHTEVGPVTDHLNRFRTIGWTGMLGHALYRPQALINIETASSAL